MSAIIAIILTFITSGVFIAAGRIVFTHSGNAKLNSSPLGCFFTGLGVWYVWVLLLHGCFGASLPIVWYTFLASTAALALVLTRVLKLEKEHAFFWPKVATGALLILPALFYLTTDGPVLWAELSHFLKNMDHMLRLGAVADANRALELDIFNPAAHLASQIVSLPVMLMMGAFKPAVATLFNGVVLVLAAAELARLCRINVSWQNVVFVSAATLFGVTLFNPFFIETLVFSSYPNILAAGAIFALFIPLLRQQDLPQGLSCIPYGLAGAYAVGCSSIGLGLVVLFVGLFILRDVLSRKHFKQGFSAEALAGWGVLLLLPLFAKFMADYQSISLGFHEATSGTGHGALKAIALQSTLMLTTWPIITLVVAAFPLWGIVTLIQKGATQGLLSKGQVLVPSVLIVGYILICGGLYLGHNQGAATPFGDGFIHYTLHLQFLILLPLWRVAFEGLCALMPKHKQVSATISLVLAMLFVATIVTNAERLKFEPSAPLDHTLRVAEALKSDKIVGWRDKVAVLDAAETRGYYAVALSYGLRHHAHVRPVLQELADAQGHFDKFHDALVADNYNFLWVHAVTPDIAAVLGDQLRPDYSYLYQVTPAGLRPIKSYAHGSYTYKSASYIPNL